MLQRLATLHKALSDATRLRVLHLLLGFGELCVCDVEAALEISQSSASRHLITLKQAGLLADRRDGTWVYYRIAEDLPAPARAALDHLARALDGDPATGADLRRARERRRSPTCRPAGASPTPEASP